MFRLLSSRDMDWDDLRHFLALARTETLARAAQRLQINATTVSRRMGALEEQLGLRLFDRTPDGWLLTPEGRELLPNAERMEAEALAVERQLLGADQRAAGGVRVSVTEMIGTRFIAPHLPRLAERHPDITLELSCTSRSVSLARREADIALRLARPREQRIVIRRLTTIPLALYASRDYVEQNGLPDLDATGLSGHAVILFADAPAFALENAWFDARRTGARIVLRSDSVSSIFSATVAGLGMALLPRAVAESDAALVPVPSDTTPTPRVIWQAVHEDLMKSARIRAVLDFLAEVLRAVDADIPPTDDGTPA